LEEDHQRYVEQRNLCAKLSIQTQESHYSELINSAENKQKSLFKVVDKLLDKKDERILPAHTDPVDLANKFNKYYVEKIDKLRESIPESAGYQQKRKKFDGVKLSVFDPTTIEEVKEILTGSGVKTSSEDPFPAEILKQITDEMYPALVKLVNLSLSEGSVDGIKRSELDPLLKKLGLDSEVYKNYRPVNNLVFLSKLIERIVNRRIDAQMEANNLHNKKAFGYKTGHSTETMMLGMMNDVLTGFDQNKCTVMLFLDLSAAFDTIDVEKLLIIK
jgi:DNA-directed RNA polymerase subunit F